MNDSDISPIIAKLHERHSRLGFAEGKRAGSAPGSGETQGESYMETNSVHPIERPAIIIGMCVAIVMDLLDHVREGSAQDTRILREFYTLTHLSSIVPATVVDDLWLAIAARNIIEGLAESYIDRWEWTPACAEIKEHLSVVNMHLDDTDAPYAPAVSDRAHRTQTMGTIINSYKPKHLLKDALYSHK
jgi:hypothetical protein